MRFRIVSVVSGIAISASFVGLISLSGAARGQQADANDLISQTDFYELLTANENWNAVRLLNAGQGLDCAIVARPKSGHTFREETLVDAERNERVAFVTWAASDFSEQSGQVSLVIGAPVVQGAHALHRLIIDERIGFAMYGDGERLHLHPSDTQEVLGELRKGAEMFVQAQLEDGDIVRDTYTLDGVIAATTQMREGCANLR